MILTPAAVVVAISTTQHGNVLKAGTTFDFYFDYGPNNPSPIASFTLTSALKIRGMQSFSVMATLPHLPPPPKYITSLDFAVVQPGAQPDGKDSPCMPTFILGTPG